MEYSDRIVSRFEAIAGECREVPPSADRRATLFWGDRENGRYELWISLMAEEDAGEDLGSFIDDALDNWLPDNKIVTIDSTAAGIVSIRSGKY